MTWWRREELPHTEKLLRLRKLLKPEARVIVHPAPHVEFYLHCHHTSFTRIGRFKERLSKSA